MSEHPLVQSILNFKDETIQKELTEKATEQLFGDNESQKNVALTINDFIDDYLANGRDMPLNDWLLQRFSQYPEIWKDEEEKQETANIIINTVEDLIKNQLDLERAISKGKTIPNFINKKINSLSEQYGIDAQDIGEGIESGLEQGNAVLEKLFFGQAIPKADKPMELKGLDLARQISKSSQISAQLNLASYGLRSIGSRLLKAAKGEKNLSRTEELTKIIRSSIDSAENKGIQVAISGGVVVSAKKGWIKGVFDSVEKVEGAIEKTREYFNRIQDLTLNVADGFNDVRILDKVEQGALQYVDVAREKAKFTVTKNITKVETAINQTIKKAGGKFGKQLGQKIGAVLGSLSSPAGTVVGATIGSIVGEQVGEIVADKVGEKVVKPVSKTVKKIADKAIDYIADTAKTVVSTVRDVAETVCEGLKNTGSKVLSFLGF